MPNLIIVSNRLPVSVKKIDDKLEFFPSAGGLATGLSSYTTNGLSTWVGWPGIANEQLTDNDRHRIVRELKKYHCHPVFLDQAMLDAYYNEYSNSVLWPLFHELEVNRGDTPENWKAYRAANQLFTDAVLRLSKPGGTIWVHDYQLLLVPEQLRIKRPSDKIGFFLHIPFPNAEIFMTTTHATKLLQGVLGADLIGVHTKTYAANMLDSCRRADIGAVDNDEVALPNRVARVTDFPMGIDYDKFASATKQREVAAAFRRLKLKYLGKKVILMSDRLDPTKGLVERLKAYQSFLHEYKKMHGKVVLSMIAVPSRTDIDEYKKLRVEVEKLVDDINTEYGTANWKPVEYIFDALPFAEYAALYRRADVAFIAPIKDGMNLVAKEYLAIAPKHDGILVLSETAGAAQELKDAILVNPSKPKSMVEGLAKAFTTPRRELRRRTAAMQRHLKHFTVERWADTFMDTLAQPIANPKVHVTRTLKGKYLSALISDYHQAAKRLIMLDYDGTLRGYEDMPHLATPDPKINSILQKLAADKRNDIVLVSGRSKDDLQDWFGDLPIGLAAEHGALYRRAEGRNWHKMTAADPAWRRKVIALFEYYKLETPGTLIEKKEWGIAWHYRGATPYASQKSLVGLRRLLKPLARTYDLRIRNGHKVVEVSPKDINKARATQEWLVHDHDFTMAIGDDVTDEDMFKALPPDGYGIKVGPGRTAADYRLPDAAAVLRLLRKL